MAVTSHNTIEYISFWSDMQGEFLPVIVRKVLAVARARGAVVLEGETEGGALAGDGALEGDLGMEG